VPQNRHWVVTQTREIKVSGNTAADAARVAQAALNNEEHDFRHIGGMVEKPAKDIGLNVREV
jgi:hypothetical protein